MKVAQSCLPLCNAMDYTVDGILQGRILEWVAFPFSRGSSGSETKATFYYSGNCLNVGPHSVCNSQKLPHRESTSFLLKAKLERAAFWGENARSALDLREWDGLQETN